MADVIGSVTKRLRLSRLALQGLEWPGTLGLGLLAAALVLAATVLLPGKRHLQQLEHDIAGMRSAMEHHRGQWVDHSPQAALNAFYGFLPPEASAAGQVAAILDAAEANGIEVDRIEYVLTRDRAARLSRYQMTLPLRGTYPDIRYFVIDLLNTMPALAINELSFKREDAHSQGVEARLRLTIYLGRPS